MFYDWLPREERFFRKTNSNGSRRIIRPSWKEARIIARLIRIHNLKDQNMIERRPKEIRNSQFWIDRSFGKVAGSVGLIDWSPDGIEIVSHFADERFRGKGVGKNLLEYAIKEARKINPVSIFLFTTKVEYYKKLGFIIADRRTYPRKLQERCGNCPKNEAGPGIPPCPEIAMKYAGNL